MNYQRTRQFNEGIPKLKKISTDLRSSCLMFDSRDRNRNKFPNTNKYGVYFNPGNTYQGAAVQIKPRNVYSLRIVEAILPNVAQNYAYISLVIPELSENIYGTNNTLQKAFAILLPDEVNGDFISCRFTDMCNCFKKFSPPLGSLSRLTFEFYTPAGALINFGTDNAVGNPVDDSVQNFLVFEVVEVVSNSSIIDPLIV
jgi:hypothetical protein